LEELEEGLAGDHVTLRMILIPLDSTARLLPVKKRQILLFLLLRNIVFFSRQAAGEVELIF
jgi:hypothetical protein